MIHSIFILNGNGEIIIEKHYRGTTSRSEATLPSPATPATTLPPFLPTNKGAQVHLHRDGLTFLALLHTDTHPLFTTQFLTTLGDTFLDYFGELNEHAIKDNFITVYELLDEMLDNGFPLTLESNTLKGLIRPPSMLNRVFEQLGADNSASLTNTPSYIPWRRSNVKYAQNEVYVDITETLDAVLTPTGRILHLLVCGDITINSRLSGTPEISMRLHLESPLDDIAIHHSVRNPTSLDTGMLTFVPPDGLFDLMTYSIRNPRGIRLPVEVSSRIDFDYVAASGAVSISLIPRFPIPAPSRKTSSSATGSVMLAQVMSAAGKMGMGDAPVSIMNEVVVRIPFGDGVSGSSLSANQGTVKIEDGFCTWTIGAVQRGVTPSLTGHVTLKDGSKERISKPPVLIQFRIPGFSASGIGVDSLELDGSERYKYYKGLKCITKAGVYEVRT